MWSGRRRILLTNRIGMKKVKEAINPQTGKLLKGYLIYSDGRLYRNFKNNNGKPKFLKPQGKTYQSYRISLNGVPKNFLVHRIVACSFIGFSKKAVNHKDGNIFNNKIQNLEFVTHTRNVQHALYDLRQAKKFKLGLSDYLIALAMKKSGRSYREIAKKLNVKSHTSIMDLLQNPGHRVRLERAERNAIQNKSFTANKKTSENVATKNSRSSP